MLWKAKRGDDLYVAGIAGDKVLVVGVGAIHALALKDGKEVWRLAIGVPSGFGVLNGAAYLVPLTAGPHQSSRKSLSLRWTRVGCWGHAHSRNHRAISRFHDGVILSQSPTAVTAFGKGKAK